MLTYLLLTERCNLSCKHCIRGGHPPSDMSFADYCLAVRELKRAFPQSGYVLTGGEPTLNPDFAEMVGLLASEEHGEIIVNTNGTTDCFDKICNWMKRPNVHVQFSVDGSPHDHDAIRGLGVFEKVRRSMDTLRSAGIRFWVSTVVTGDNVGSLGELRDLLVGYGVEKWHVNSILPFGCGACLRPLSVAKWNETVDWLVETTPLRLGIKKLYDFKALARMSTAELLSLQSKAIGRKKRNCGCGNRKLYVYPSLDVFGCTCVKSFPFGNLHRLGADRLMSTENAQQICNYTLEPTSPCRKCRYVGLCNGGCVGMSIEGFGRLGVGDPRCPEFQRLSK